MIFRKIIFISILLVAGYTFSYAEEKSLSAFPKEMMFEGKPIDPVCIHVAEQEKTVTLQSQCAEPLGIRINDDGSPVRRGELEIRTDNSLGYPYQFELGSGEFRYNFIGKTNEGLLIKTGSSGGGSGYFTELAFYKREGDVLTKVRKIAAGDKCAGHIEQANVENGNLFYAYSVTPLELHQLYQMNPSKNMGLTNTHNNCGAIIHTKNEKAEFVELIENPDLPDCLKVEYKKQFLLNKKLSYEDARVFLESMSRMCSVKE